MTVQADSSAPLHELDGDVQRPVKGLGRIAARGAAVTMGGQGVRMVIQIASVIILAKLLTPHDYGVVAMVLAVAGIADIFRDFGLSSAAVQAKSLSHAQRNNLFWLNSALGLLLCLIVAAGSPLIASFYHEREVRGIALALSLTFLLNGLATQFRADLDRHLRFGQLALVDIGTQVAGLVVGVVLAVNGAGYWALVAQQLLNSALTLAAVAILAGWLPRRPTRNAEMSGLLRFGWHLVGTQLIGYATNNVDSVVIGHRFGAAPLGFYNRAFQLLMAPLTQVRAPTTTVALPVLSRIESDNKRYSAFLIRGQIGLGYTLVVGLAVVGAAAEPIVQLCLGSQWSAVTPILRILAFAGATTTLSYAGYWVFLSRGLTRELLRYTVLVFVLRVVCVLVGSVHGLIGVAVGYAVAPTIAAPLSLWWLSRKTFIPLRELLLGYLRVLAVAVLAAGTAYASLRALPELNSLLAVLLAALVVPAVYLVTAALIPSIRSDLTLLFEVGAMILRKNGASASGAGATAAAGETLDRGTGVVVRARQSVLLNRLGRPWVIGVLATLVSLAGSWIPSVWSDEAATMAAATRTWGQLWTLVQHVDIVHALYYGLMHLWFDVVGASALTLRLPSAMAVGLGAAGVVVLGRRLHSAWLGAIAGVLFAFLPRVTWMGIEGRSSAMSTAAAVWLTILFLRALDSGDSGDRADSVDRADSADSVDQADSGDSVDRADSADSDDGADSARPADGSRARSRWLAWWAGYGIAAALGITLSIYLALLVIAHGITILLRCGASRRLAAWAVAGAGGLLLASPVILTAKSQSGQVGWIRQTGLKSVKSVVIDQWFGTYGAKSAPVALLGWFLIGFGVYVALRRRPVRSWPLSQQLAIPWLLFPTAALFLYSMVGTPLYAAKYLAFCSPAVALLIAAGIGSLATNPLRLGASRATLGEPRTRPDESQSTPGDTRTRRGARRLSQVAVVAVIVLALPSYAYARRGDAKDGSDWKLAAARIAAHDRRGDAVLFGNLYNNRGVTRGSARSVEYAYPADFVELRDVESDGQPPPRDAEFGSSAAFSQTAPKLGDASRVWVVYDHSKAFADPGNPDNAALAKAGFTLSKAWRGAKTDIFLMTR
jgi:PST family polysaccharide transporter